MNQFRCYPAQCSHPTSSSPSYLPERWTKLSRLAVLIASLSVLENFPTLTRIYVCLPSSSQGTEWHGSSPEQHHRVLQEPRHRGKVFSKVVKYLVDFLHHSFVAEGPFNKLFLLLPRSHLQAIATLESLLATRGRKMDVVMEYDANNYLRRQYSYSNMKFIELP